MSIFSDISARADVPLLNTYADSVAYHPRQGDEYTLTGILNSGEAVQTGERVYMTLSAPLANFTGGEPRKGDRLVSGDVTYAVVDVTDTGMAWRKLSLSVTTPL